MGLRIMTAWLRRLLRHEKVRFAAVGAINTSVDFIVFFSLANVLLVPTIAANIMSTTTALAVSYLLNKKAVFGNTDANNIRQVVLFIVVTLSGLWVLQGTVITLLAPILEPIVGKGGSLLLAKLIATLFSLMWNYLWYSRVVFRKGRA